MEAVQEFLVQEAGELLDRLNGSLSGKVVETVLSLARTMMCYLSGMQTSLVGGGVGQPTITAKLATLVKHIIIKAGEASEKVLCKRETRPGELVAILNQWVWLMEGEEYSMDCFKFLYSKVIECASLMAKLEWCVSDNCREKDNATSQVGKVVRNGNASNGSARKDPFDDFDDFSNDSIGTGEETDFDLTGQADPAKDALELDSFLLPLSSDHPSPRARGGKHRQEVTQAARQVNVL